jgi:hypothetical protein
MEVRRLRKRLRIGEVARLVGVTRKSVRHWPSKKAWPCCSPGRCRSPGPGDGFQTDPEDGGIYLAMDGMTDLILILRSPVTVQGIFRTAGPALKIHLAADQPESRPPSCANASAKDHSRSRQAFA